MPSQTSFPSLAALRRLQTLNQHVNAPLRRTGIGRIGGTNAASGWTCASCRSQLSSLSSPAASYNSTFARRLFTSSSKRYTNSQHSSGSSSSSGHTNNGNGYGKKDGKNGKRTLLLASTTGAAAATAGLFAFSDDIKYTYEAAERTGRVASALVKCVNDYRQTLNAREKIDDVEEKARLLNECHQRCADRTLEVLERSGGIFIKLGQHLVGSPHRLGWELSRATTSFASTPEDTQRST